MKRITFIRHAKAVWQNSTQSDFDRSLDKQGEDDSALMGRVLWDLKLIPELILSSPAKRAVSTAYILSDAVAYPENSIRTDPLIYEGSIDDHLTIIHNLENHLHHIFWIGHNPYLTMMGRWISDESVANLPPCGLLSVQIDVQNWDLIGEGTGQVVLFDFPTNHDQDIH